MLVRWCVLVLPLLAVFACASPVHVIQPEPVEQPVQPSAVTHVQPGPVGLPTCPIFVPPEPELDWTLIPGEEISIPFEGKSTREPAGPVISDDDVPVRIPSPWGHR